MKKLTYLGLAVLLLSGLAVGCGGDDDHDHDHDGHGHDHDMVPAEFRNYTNTLAGDATAAAAGQELYGTNCALCHGADGAGVGSYPGLVGEELPDNYLFWRIHDGVPNTAMFGFGDSLSDEQISQIITYIRTL